MDAAARRALLAWYASHRRDLPWRRTRDPYAVWVSEAMLQQTRVDVVAPRWSSWMRRFPTLASLAAATAADVQAEWSGLGYYRRAAALHAAARQVVSTHGATVPGTAAQLRGLPGVGPYTAAAVASIAFGEPVACVDGNVARVASRRLGLRSIGPANRRRIDAHAQAAIAAAVAEGGAAAGDWNQAVMELGATVCTPRAPACGRCPLAQGCKARASGDPERYPAPKARPAHAPQRVHLALAVRDGRVLVQRPAAGLLAGMWGLPGGPADVPLADHVLAQTGHVVASMNSSADSDGQPGQVPVASFRHVFSHRTWDVGVFAVKVLADGHAPASARHVADPAAGDAAWLPLADVLRPRAVAASALLRTALAHATPREPDASAAPRPGKATRRQVLQGLKRSPDTKPSRRNAQEAVA